MLRPRWLLVLLLVVALLIGAGISAGLTWRLMPPKDPRIPGIVHTGDDPALQPDCLADVVVGASATRLDNYLMEIKWSATCRAAWGRVSRYDDKALGNRIRVTLFLRDDPDGPATQRTDDADTQVSYTYLIADTGVGGTICVKGEVTDGPSVIDLGDPICL